MAPLRSRRRTRPSIAEGDRSSERARAILDLRPSACRARRTSRSRESIASFHRQGQTARVFSEMFAKSRQFENILPPTWHLSRQNVHHGSADARRASEAGGDGLERGFVADDV